MADSKSDATPSGADGDELHNVPMALSVLAISPPLMLIGVPMANYLAVPGGFYEKVQNAIVDSFVYIGSAGSKSSISVERVVPALAALYIFGTYAFGGASSSAALWMGSKDGRDNKNPRAEVQGLKGLPLRMHSAHAHMIEIFPAFALAAGIVIAMAPGDRYLINLLGVHVFSRLFVFWPSYVLGWQAPRLLGHMVGLGSVISVGWKLAVR